MKSFFFPALKLSLALMVIVCGIYPLAIAGIGKKITPGNGDGVTVKLNGRVVGYANIGQKFTKDKYFWSRPSAANYQADAGVGSNKGPSNPDYLKTVSAAIDTFLKHNPGVLRKQIPSEMVTASGSGLDPDISLASALIQVKRVAQIRKLDEKKVTNLVNSYIEQPLFGLFGPAVVNVLKLNVALDGLK